MGKGDGHRALVLAAGFLDRALPEKEGAVKSKIGSTIVQKLDYGFTSENECIGYQVC